MIKSRNYSSLMLLFSIICVVVFVFSRSSWSFVFSDVTWGFILFVSFVSLIVYAVLNIKTIKFDFSSFMLLAIILIVAFNNNYEFKTSINITSTFINSIFILVIGMLAFICLSNSNKWHRFFIYGIGIVGAIYAIITVVCVINPSFYNSIIRPVLLSHYSSQTVLTMSSPVAGIFIDYGLNGYFISLSFCVFTSYLLVRGSTKKKMAVIFLLVVISMMAILFGGKKTIFISLLVSLAVPIFIGLKKQKRYYKIIILIAVGAVILFLLSVVIPEVRNMFTRLFSFSLEEEYKNVDSRQVMWNDALHYFSQSPLFGFGWRWFKNNLTYGIGRDVHNCYLQLLTENGIVFSFPFFAFFFVELWKAFNNLFFLKKNSNCIKTHDALSIVASLMLQLNFIVSLFFTTLLYSYSIFLLYILSCAISNYHYHFFKSRIK